MSYESQHSPPLEQRRGANMKTPSPALRGIMRNLNKEWDKLNERSSDEQQSTVTGTLDFYSPAFTLPSEGADAHLTQLTRPTRRPPIDPL